MNNLVNHPYRTALLAAGIAVGCTLVAAVPAEDLPASARASIASDTANRNLYIGGGQVRPSGPVKGDFMAGGGKVIVDQAVEGDVSVAGGSVDVRAPVGDDVRAAGADVNIASTVGGELIAAGANIALTSAAVIGHGARLYGSSVSIDGRIEGDLKATAQKVTINGEVRGNARLIAEEIELGPRARIGGALSYASKSELRKADGATIAGSVTRDEDSSGTAARRGRDGSWTWEGSVRGPSWAGTVVSFFALLAFAAIFMLIVPGFGVQASERVRTAPWLALAVGFGSVIAVPVFALLLIVTLLGIPLAIAVLALYPALLLAGFVIGVLVIARLLAAGMGKQAPNGFTSTIGYFAGGLLLILLTTKVPIVGGWLVVLLSLAGVGGCVLELYGRRKGPTDALAGRPDLIAAQTR